MLKQFGYHYSRERRTVAEYILCLLAYKRSLWGELARNGLNRHELAVATPGEYSFSESQNPLQHDRLGSWKGGASLPLAVMPQFSPMSSWAFNDETPPYPMAGKNRRRRREPTRSQIFNSGFVFGFVFGIVIGISVYVVLKGAGL